MQIANVLVAGLVSAAAALVPGPVSSAQEGSGSPVLELRGFAVNITGVGKGRSGDLVIRIDSWSSAEERARLRKVLTDEGAAGLGKALAASEPVGSIHTRSGGEVDVVYAGETALPGGGRRIVLATSALGVPEDGSNPRADTYEFLAVEIQLKADGKGEGRTAGPQQLEWDEKAGALVTTGFGTRPVWLTEVEVVSPQ